MRCTICTLLLYSHSHKFKFPCIFQIIPRTAFQVAPSLLYLPTVSVTAVRWKRMCAPVFLVAYPRHIATAYHIAHVYCIIHASVKPRPNISNLHHLTRVEFCMQLQSLLSIQISFFLMSNYFIPFPKIQKNTSSFSQQ